MAYTAPPPRDPLLAVAGISSAEILQRVQRRRRTLPRRAGWATAPAFDGDATRPLRLVDCTGLLAGGRPLGRFARRAIDDDPGVDVRFIAWSVEEGVFQVLGDVVPKIEAPLAAGDHQALHAYLAHPDAGAAGLTFVLVDPEPGPQVYAAVVTALAHDAELIVVSEDPERTFGVLCAEDEAFRDALSLARQARLPAVASMTDIGALLREHASAVAAGDPG